MSTYKKAMAELEQKRPSAYEYRKNLLVKAIIKASVIAVISIAAPCVAFYEDPAVMLGLAIVLGIACPLMMVKPWKILRKKFAGSIVGIEPYMKRVGVPSATNSTVAMGDALYINIIVDDGERRHTFEVPAEYGLAYKAGDRVLSTHGFLYPINLTPHENDVCPKCGNMLPESKDACMVCGFINE